MARSKEIDDIKSLDEVLNTKSDFIYDEIKMFEEVVKEEVKMAEAKKLTYKDMKIEDIMEWCIANNQIEWLKAIKDKKVPYKVYPRLKVPRTDENGNNVVNEKGKILYKSVVDKTKAPRTQMKKPNFMHIKNEFVKAFMPELMPVKKEKEPNMYEKIDLL